MFFAAMLLNTVLIAQNNTESSDALIRRQIINESIMQYPGNCPCPYSVDRSGKKCGARSAWSKASGYTPICYPKEINEYTLMKYKKERGLSRSSEKFIQDNVQ